jgi:hypothetical protein
MAASTTSNLSDQLLRTYSRRLWFAPFERSATKFLDSVEDFPNEEPLGIGRYFEVYLADPHNSLALAEGGSWPTPTQPISQQGTVAAKQIVATFGLSEMLLSAGKGAGAFGDTLHRHVTTTTRNLMSNINRCTLGHGTGRLAVAESSNGTATTSVWRNPEHVLQVRAGMYCDVFTAETFGSSEWTTAQQISAVNFSTRTLTHASLPVTAGSMLYIFGSRGLGPVGLRGINDAGTLTSTLFGIPRAGYPEINAQVISASGGSGVQPYSEALVRKGINQVFFTSGAEVEEIWCNRGIISEHLNHLVGDRVYQISDSGVPSYKIGYNPKTLAFQNGGKDIPFKVDEDLPAREMHLIVKSLYRRHILRKASWMGDDSGEAGSDQPILLQSPATNTYSTNKVAAMVWMGNLGHISPKAGCLINQIADAELCGDSV